MNRRRRNPARQSANSSDEDYEIVQRRDMPNREWGYGDGFANRMLLHSAKRNKIAVYKPHPLIISNKFQNYIGVVLQSLAAIPSIHEIFSDNEPHFIQHHSLSDNMISYFMMQKFFDHDVPIAIDGPVHALIRKNSVWSANRMQDAAELLKELLGILIEEVQIRKHIPDHGTTNMMRRRFNRFGGNLRRQITNITQNSMDMVRRNSKPDIQVRIEERPWDGVDEIRPWDGPSALRLRRTNLPLVGEEAETISHHGPSALLETSRRDTDMRSSNNGRNAGGGNSNDGTDEIAETTQDGSASGPQNLTREDSPIHTMQFDSFVDAWESHGSNLARHGGVIGAFTHYVQGSTVEAISCNGCRHRRSGGEIPFNVLDIPPFVGPNAYVGSVTDSLASYSALRGFKGGTTLWCKTCNFWFGKGQNEATVRMEIEIQPRILFLKIDRFTLSKHHVHQYDKMPHWIEFEEFLDIAPYVFQGGLKPGTKLEYELCSVIEHVGPVLNNASYYKSYCKAKTGENKSVEWFECHDDSITLVNSEKVFKCQAYILVYEKTDFTWESYLQKRREKEILEEEDQERSTRRARSPEPPRAANDEARRGPERFGRRRRGETSGAGPSMANIRRALSPDPLVRGFNTAGRNNRRAFSPDPRSRNQNRNRRAVSPDRRDRRAFSPNPRGRRAFSPGPRGRRAFSPDSRGRRAFSPDPFDVSDSRSRIAFDRTRNPEPFSRRNSGNDDIHEI